jgi:hypothetical protein
MTQNQARSGPPSRLVSLWVLWGLVLLGFAIQISGALLTDSDMKPVLQPNLILKMVGIAGVVITTLAPVFAISSLSLLPRETRGMQSGLMRLLAWAGAVLLVVLSFGEFLWSCSGHPTWFMAYN